MSTTVNAKATYYHLTPLDKDASTSWIAGGPRKGISNGQCEIGMVFFDKAEIAAAINGGMLTKASLLLNRDTAYGTGTVDISIAPAMYDDVSSIMTYAECMNIIRRGWHYLTTVSGETASIQLPVGWLSGIQGDGFSGVMIYQEEGEGTGSIARFTSAQLELSMDASYVTPVWCRPIGQGDIISSPMRSHQADLYELLHCLHIRQSIDEITLSSFDDIDIGAYDEWKDAIDELQDGTGRAYTAESKDAIDWIEVGNNDLPNAAVINQLRNALESPRGNTGTIETMEVQLYARTFFDHLNTDFTVNKEALTTWDQKGPWSGMNWEYVIDNGEKKKKYTRRFGFWLINDITAGKTINKAKIRLTRNKGANGSQTINLYPVKISSLPATKMKVNDVMDTSVIVGTAQAAIGEMVEIELSDAFRTALGTTYYGVGVDDHQHWTNYGTSATLIINYT